MMRPNETVFPCQQATQTTTLYYHQLYMEYRGKERDRDRDRDRNKHSSFKFKSGVLLLLRKAHTFIDGRKVIIPLDRRVMIVIDSELAQRKSNKLTHRLPAKTVRDASMLFLAFYWLHIQAPFEATLLLDKIEPNDNVD
ncbi:hypothetical protein T02_11214 [Trichinella nativa]|uniref:Uncharacterized protein n=1 Tax=Trichinella nativa TaxID=6335 RepID=A0A0V1L400_9BILA|nr:hypothetical protein T02_11214 [Trichinella nativa]